MIRLKEIFDLLVDEDKIALVQDIGSERRMLSKDSPIPNDLAERRVLAIAGDNQGTVEVLIADDTDRDKSEWAEGGAGPNPNTTKQSINLDPIQLAQDGNTTLKSITISMYLNFEPKPDPA